jgi:hypothetical protein
MSLGMGGTIKPEPGQVGDVYENSDCLGISILNTNLPLVEVVCSTPAYSRSAFAGVVSCARIGKRPVVLPWEVDDQANALLKAWQCLGLLFGSVIIFRLSNLLWNIMLIF